MDQLDMTKADMHKIMNYDKLDRSLWNLREVAQHLLDELEDYKEWAESEGRMKRDLGAISAFKRIRKGWE